MRRTLRGGSHYQYLSNTGYLNGTTMHAPHFLRGSDTALANPTPWARTMAGGKKKKKRRKKTLRR